MYDESESIKDLKTLIEKKAVKNAGKVALKSGEHQITYDAIESSAAKIAGRMKDLGVSQGVKVALMMTNSFEFVYCWFAAMKLGAVLVPLNISLKGDLLAYQLNDSESKICIIEKSFLEPYQAVKSRLQHVKHHFLLDRDDPNKAPEGFTPFNDLYGEEVRGGQGPQYYDPAMIIYTSGTTGPPKGVVLPHYAYINTALANAVTAEAREGDVFFSTVPFFHTSGQLQVVLPALIHDLQGAFEPWFSASRFWDQVRQHDATVVFLISSMINILLKQPESERDKAHKVRVVMTGGAKKQDWEAFESRFGVKVLEGFGMTETAAIAIFNRSSACKVGSVGKPLPHFEAKIVDDYDNEVPPMVKGELVIRPKVPFTMMLEYYKKPEKTVEAWRNLWFHTGDILYRDEEGFFYYVERKKDVIRRRGENIAPYDIESVVNQHPKVLEAVAVGVPSEVGEEDVKIYVKLKPGEQLDALDLLKWCDDRLPYYMVPRYVEYVDEIPKTPTQRAQRYLLKQRGIGQAFDAYKAGFRPKRPL
ncbi:MAG: ATP-dependent acyl-CoA ligase [Nitrososphaerales archaeon]